MIETLEQIDRNLLLAVNSHYSAFLDVIMYYVSQLWFSIPLYVFWVILLLKKYALKKIALLILLAGLLVILTDQSSNQVKHAVKRYRPSHNLEIKNQIHSVNDYHGGQYGFFSGHAANTFGIATFLFLLFQKRSTAFKSHFYIWAITVSFTRIYLGVHYPSDILVGMIDGILFGYLIFKLAQLIFKNKFNDTLPL